MTFNLIHEPWIPVAMTDGSAAEVSLRGAFREAGRIRKIGGDLPTQSFATTRIMLAICHDAIGFTSQKSVARAIEDGIDVDAIDAYLDKHEDRFDLFHPQRPFVQVADLRTAKGEASGLEKLIADVPNGTPFLTVRSPRSLARITAAEAARWLIHAQAFDPSGIRSGAVGDPLVKGGKGYPIGPSWCGQLGGVIVHGTSLAQTLAYNLVPMAKNPDDRPVWAQDEPQTEQRQLEAVPAGPLSVLTWQSRRIRLVGDAEGVTGVVLSQGDQLRPQNRQNLENMSAWRYSKPQTAKAGGTPTYMPLKHDPERSTWRGLPALLGDARDTVDGAPATLMPGTLRALADNEHLDDENLSLKVGVELVGMTYGSQEAVVEQLSYDMIDLRVSLLAEEALGVRILLGDAVRLADDVVRVVGKLAANLARATGDVDGTDGALSAGKNAAWSALDLPARLWVAGLDAKTNTESAARAWQEVLLDMAREQIDLRVRGANIAAVTGRKTSYGFMNSALAGVYAEKELRDLLPLAYQTTTTPQEKR